eukprot:gnl/Carplike_NY0171/7706_a10645_199.p1 GENE.gnl/Carplike_NY0171/7706_a10645_199~~gnl/Carplike_NY0171/7706_a10645_199.p1  ORF type:complete len:663 (-),score=160.43 gnl/Carplike_NY0171/7706_a10645_199:330-2024(-)
MTPVQEVFQKIRSPRERAKIQLQSAIKHVKQKGIQQEFSNSSTAEKFALLEACIKGAVSQSDYRAAISHDSRSRSTKEILSHALESGKVDDPLTYSHSPIISHSPPPRSPHVKIRMTRAEILRQQTIKKRREQIKSGSPVIMHDNPISRQRGSMGHRSGSGSSLSTFDRLYAERKLFDERKAKRRQEAVEKELREASESREKSKVCEGSKRILSERKHFPLAQRVGVYEQKKKRRREEALHQREIAARETNTFSPNIGKRSRELAANYHKRIYSAPDSYDHDEVFYASSLDGVEPPHDSAGSSDHFVQTEHIAQGSHSHHSGPMLLHTAPAVTTRSPAPRHRGKYQRPITLTPQSAARAAQIAAGKTSQQGSSSRSGGGSKHSSASSSSSSKHPHSSGWKDDQKRSKRQPLSEPSLYAPPDMWVYGDVSAVVDGGVPMGEHHGGQYYDDEEEQHEQADDMIYESEAQTAGMMSVDQLGSSVDQLRRTHPSHTQHSHSMGMHHQPRWDHPEDHHQGAYHPAIEDIGAVGDGYSDQHTIHDGHDSHSSRPIGSIEEELRLLSEVGR